MLWKNAKIFPQFSTKFGLLENFPKGKTTMSVEKIAGLYEVRRTLKDGTAVLNYRVKITRKNFKIDKLFNEDELEQAIELIKRNRYVCAYCNGKEENYAKFFLNEDLLESLKRDLPYLLK